MERINMPHLPVATLRPGVSPDEWKLIRQLVTYRGRLREFEWPAPPEVKYLWKWVGLNISPLWEQHEIPDRLYSRGMSLERVKRLDELVCAIVQLIPREHRHGQLKHTSMKILTGGLVYGE